jgi:cell division protein FtsB
MSELSEKLWKEVWANMKADPFPYITTHFVCFLIGVVITAIVFEHVFIGGKNTQIETLKTENESLHRQIDGWSKEKENLVSQIKDLQSELAAAQKQNKELEGKLVDMPKQIFATPEALMSPVLQNMTIRICDLTREDFVIHDKTFENCHIYGPAIIACDNVIMTDSIITAAVPPDPNSFFIETTSQFCLGAVLFKDCTFKHCALDKIGIIGTHEQITNLKQQLPSIVEIKGNI